MDVAIQDSYPAELAQCYGCGAHNPHGLKIKSFCDGEGAVARFTPQPYHTAGPGFVYGGLIASLIDCHATGTAAAAASRAEGRPVNTEPFLRFVTASLHVDYLAPTPMGVELVLHGHATEVKGRKVTVAVTLEAEGVVCAKGTVIAVRIPQTMTPPARG